MARKQICPNCGYIGEAIRVESGSSLLELFLWIFVLPGLVYSFWRITTRHMECPECGGAPNMIPLDSPRGKKLRQELSE